MQVAPLSFERHAAERLLEQRAELTRSWVARIATELHVRPRRALPSDRLLDVFPEVLQYVAGFLCADEEPVLTAEPTVIEALRALARQRHRQGCDPQELIREFELLAQLLDGACLTWLRSYPGTPSPESVVRVTGRANRAPILMAEITIGAYREQEAAEHRALASQMREFADTLLHELRSPLGAAEGAALLLENDEMVRSSQERRRFAGLIQRNLRRARTVLGNVRELALADGPEPGPERRLPLRRVLDEVLAEIREVAREAKVRVEIAEPVPDIRVDASRVEIILLNLIGNAIKYADPARPLRRVRLGFGHQEEKGVWSVCVSDNGLGIPPEHHDRIFQRFFRAHPERSEGTGLGLAIVLEAVQQLGGRIEFQSEQGAGSTFRVSLPCRQTEVESS